MSVLEGLAEYVANSSGADGVVGLTFNASGSGGNVFVEALPTTPDTAVAFLSIGGPEADTMHPWNSPTVQVIVRGDMDPRTALNLWYALFDVLHGLRNVTLPDGTYLESCIATNSGPARLPVDVSGRYSYSLNLRIEVMRPTSERPATW